jgi:hypothetical protein
MPCAKAGAQILVPGIGQTGPRPKKIAAPRRMQRLLEGRFRAPVLHISGLYSVRPIKRVLEMLLVNIDKKSEPNWQKRH